MLYSAYELESIHLMLASYNVNYLPAGVTVSEYAPAQVTPGGNLKPVSICICSSCYIPENIKQHFIQRRPNVFDVGPTLYKC